jgi:putative ABC transport system permease protein
MKLGHIAVRNIKRNRKRSILSIIATALATFTIVFMFAYLEGMMNDMRNVSFNYDSGQILIRHIDWDDKVVSLNRALDNYKSIISLLQKSNPEYIISPRLEFPGTIFDGDITYICSGVGVDFNLEEEYLSLEDRIIQGTIPANSREVLMGVGLAEELGLKVGDKFTPITMTRLGASTGITFKVSGLAKFSNPAFTNKTFLVSLEELPKMLRMDGAVTKIIIKGVREDSQYSQTDKINKMLIESGSNARAIHWKDVGVMLQMMEMASVVYDIMAFFFFILASSVIGNTMLMVVFERKREIGTITAMGMTSLEVTRLFFLEALILGALGALLGIILGAALVIPLSIVGMDLSTYMGDVDFGISYIIFPQLTIKSTLIVFLYSVFVASFISFFPSRSASKVDPVVALRAE